VTRELRLRASCSVLLTVLFALFAFEAGAATVTVVNLDGAGEGFNDATTVSPVGGNDGTTLGEQRLNVFGAAAAKWGARLESNVEILIGAEFTTLECTKLGQAGPNTLHFNFSGAPLSDTFYSAALANALAGADLCPEGCQVSNADDHHDVGAEFNSSFDAGDCPGFFDLYYGLDGNSGSDIDFLTVVLHELAHGLGFVSGVSIIDGSKLGGSDDSYMVNLEDHSTGRTFSSMTDGERLTAVTDTGDLHWTGANVVEDAAGLSAGVHPSGHVEMYAPSPAEGGSSVSHFSDEVEPTELMEPVYQEPVHDLTLTLALLEDAGWTSIAATTTSTTTTTTTLAASASCGDANDDGGINATDALLVLKRAVGLLAADDCPSCQCNVNSDSATNATDALLVLKRAVDLIDDGDLVCPAC